MDGHEYCKDVTLGVISCAFISLNGGSLLWFFISVRRSIQSYGLNQLEALDSAHIN